MIETLLLILASSAQQAAPPATSAQPGAPIVIEGKRRERKVCRKEYPPTGTRFGGRRVCRTAFEWQMAEDEARRVIEQEQLRAQAMHAYRENAKNGLADQGPP